MRILAVLALALAAAPAMAQDAERGRLLYETHCVGCHYVRVHQRPRERLSVQNLAGLRDEVYRRAGQSGRPFTLQDLSDLVAYLNRDFYKFP